MNTPNRRLMILNFAMNEDHPVLGFGVSWVRALAEHVAHIDVVTGSTGPYSVPSNVQVHDAGWRTGRDVSNSVRLRRTVRKVLSDQRPDAVFTHMAAPYAALVGPDIRLKRLRHVLWYAHVSRSKSLLLAYPWVQAIATSTPESCPLHGPKVHPLGQGIDVSMFQPVERSFELVHSAVHWGRADPSKRLGHILSSVSRVRAEAGNPSTFTQIGSPSTLEATEAWNQIVRSFPEGELLHWVPGVPRHELPRLSTNFDVFLHAFTGSMDKAALEAAASGLPVLSENPSVRREIGAWDGSLALVDQLRSFVEANPSEREQFAQMQQQRVQSKHSLTALAQKLVELIYPN